MRNKTDRLGNFWVDTTRVVIRVLLPLSIVGGIILMASGVIDNFNLTHVISTLTGGQQTIVGGPVASQEVIKEMGNNGGGFFNANSSHPFENPNPFSDWFEIFLLLVIPFALPRTFGKMVGDNRQGYALVGVMAGAVAVRGGRHQLLRVAAPRAPPCRPRTGRWRARRSDSASPAPRCSPGRRPSPRPERSTASTTRSPPSAAASPCSTSCSGEVVPGGVGAGLYGMLMLAVLTVFIGGLMVGRTPEYIGKKIRPTEMKWAAAYILATPFCALIGGAMSLGFGVPQRSILNAGPHGLTEIVYAFTSMANNNGSAFAGLTTNTGWYNLAGGVVMLVGRFVPMIFVLALAGSLARQQAGARVGRHAGDARPAVRRHARRRDHHPRRPDLLPRARAGTIR